MERLVSWVQGFALALGGPGLFLIALLDSSFLSFPEVVDLLIVVLVTHHKERMIYYAALATLGSIAGCFLLYYVGRMAAEAFLRKRFHERHVDRALALFQKHGLLAVIIPSLLPPPVPFKPFVLIAGIARVRPLDFLLAVAHRPRRTLLRRRAAGAVVWRARRRLSEGQREHGRRSPGGCRARRW